MSFKLVLTIVFQYSHICCISDYFSLNFIDCSNANTHYDLGHCIGKHTSDNIQIRWNKWDIIQDINQWIQQSSIGAQTFNKFLAINQNKFPSYIQELHGMSIGSSFDFNKLFIMSCAQEFSYFATNYLKLPPSCSDYILHQYNTQTNYNTLINSYISHNEDNGLADANNSFLIKVGNINNEIGFFSYGYAGELLTQSVGWNHHIIFTANLVRPKLQTYTPGLCRNFIARQLCTQTNLEHALLISAQIEQCIGHNYQIGEWETGNSSGSEVAYNGLHAFTIINKTNDWTFHANQYIHLDIEQYVNVDSIARQNVAKELGKPMDLNMMLNDLGNTQNDTYPIYMSGNDGRTYTLHTFGIDLLNRNIKIYTDNPRNRIVLYECNVDECENLESVSEENTGDYSSVAFKWLCVLLGFLFFVFVWNKYFRRRGYKRIRSRKVMHGGTVINVFQ
eukprot:119507_1